jgi:hypothetical protein
VFENQLCYLWGFGFFEFLTPSTLGGCNFLNFNSFLTIFSAQDASAGGVQVLFGHQKQQSLPSDLACLELKCSLTSSSMLHKIQILPNREK